MTTDKHRLNVVNAAKALAKREPPMPELACWVPWKALVKAVDDLLAVERIERRIVKVKAKQLRERPALRLVQVEDQ